MCTRSVVEMEQIFSALREERDRTPMPTDTTVVDYMCNDCHHRGSRPFHVLGLECECCFSFNTRRL
jgi:hypothetical protein